MKKFFVLLFGLVVVILIVGCLNLEVIFPFPNQAPVIISEPIITATEDQLYSYQVKAIDPNGDTLIYSFTIKPEGMSINSENGLIIWTPTNAQVGINHVTVEISDGKQSVTQKFEIEVFNVNNFPQIFSYFPANLNFKINEGSSVEFKIQALDIDSNATLSFQWFLNGKLVSNSTVSEDGSKSSWTYSVSYGDYSQKIVKVLVSDGELQDYVHWNITINDIVPPVQPTLNTVSSPTNISSQTLSGTKESNSSIWINGVGVVPLDSSTDWFYSYNLSEGTNDISITSRDAVGNESASITTTIILDTGAPEAPTLDAVVSPTNISPQTLSGNKEANTCIRINNLEVVPINSSTTWTYDFNLSEGENNISVTSQDLIGNESGETTVRIILDTISPAAPSLHEVITPTNISPQTLSGTKESNSSIWINGVGVVPLNSSTNWSYSYNLSEGTNNISITSRDAVGNESASITTTITLDTGAPEAPTLDAVVSPTNISPQTLSGNKEINTSIWINEIESVLINPDTTWSYAFGLFEGGNKIFITACDVAGNKSTTVTTDITLDTIVPETPTLNTVSSPTNISSQTLSGTKESNSSIWINGVGVVPLDSSTDWFYSYNLSEGTNDISITSRDAVGNESASITTTIILDTGAPEAPTLDAVVSPTNISPQTLSGNKEANTCIRINNLEVVPINSSTTWTYDFNLSEGENNISVTSQDLIGNESGETTVRIILDTISPAAPSLHEVITPTNISPQTLSGTKEANTSIWINGTEVILINSDTAWSYTFDLFEGNNHISVTSRDAVGNESAAVTTDIVLDIIPPTIPTLHNIISPTNICSQLLSGNKEINSSILVNGVEVISVNSNTIWSYNFELTEGENSISIISKDSAGNESNEINTIIILDTTTPAIPSLETVSSPTNISSQTLSGTKESNSSIWINGVGVVPLDSSTDWFYSYNLSEGTNDISITSRDAVGNESASITTTIILDTGAPEAPTLDAVVSPTNISPQTLSGNKEANTCIRINNLEVVPINSSTTWTYDFNLSEGENNISVTSQDLIGNESGETTVRIILDTISPAAPSLHEVITPTNISPQTLSGTKEANTSIWINGTEVILINSDTAWSYTFDLFEGNNHISVTSRDAVGNESAAVTTDIVLDIIPPTIPTLHNIISPTNICSQLLSGNKEINSSILVNGVEVISVNSNTIWSYNFELTEGENSISIISKDSAGNESNEINTIIILDTTTPAIPSLETVSSPTNISSQTLSGTKESNSSIWINGVGVVPLDSSTDWFYSYNLSEGTNDISITSRDAVGNESASITTTIILDTGAPEAPTLDAVVSPTNISPQTLSGNKEANTCIRINNLEVVPINSSTTWTYDFNLSEGENNISVTSQDLIGNESGETTVRIILDTISPAAPSLHEVITPTNISPQTLSGTKEANTSIWINGTEVISINSDTAWSYTFDLFEGNNHISITSRDAVGNESSQVTATIEYDSNIYVDESNATGIEDGTKTYPFDTIAEGIEAVTSGKSVMVASGTYNEQLIINKSITLQGASRDNTFIIGSDLIGNLITVTANDVTISGFTIDGDNSAAKGIYFDSYSSININNNIIQNNISYGINYINSSPTIENNNIKNNNYSGIDIAAGGAGIVRNNSLIFNQYGIRTCGDSSPEITRNDISNNSNTGIYCRESATPIISYNTISNNNYCGILIHNLSGNLVNPDIGNEYPSQGQSAGGNEIIGNNNYGIYNKTNHKINAENNWWGDTNGPICSGNTTTTGDRVYWDVAGGIINFFPWLSVAPQTFYMNISR